MWSFLLNSFFMIKFKINIQMIKLFKFIKSFDTDQYITSPSIGNWLENVKENKIFNIDLRQNLRSEGRCLLF